MKDKAKRRPTLEQARAVILAHQNSEQEKRNAVKRPFVGKFFKYRNSYSGGEPNWWLYGHVTALDENGWLTGWTFQRTAIGAIEIETERRSLNVDGGGWQEVSFAEFWHEAHLLLGVVAQQLCPAPVKA